MDRAHVAFAALLCAGAAVHASAGQANPRASFGPGVRVAVSRETGFVENLFGRALDLGVRPHSDEEFATAARDFLDGHADVLGVTSDDLAAPEVTRLALSRIGTTDKVSVVFGQAEGAMRVLDASICFLFDTEGRLLSLQNQTVPGARDVAQSPTLSLGAARTAAARAFGRPVEAEVSVDLALVADDHRQPALAYRIELRSSDRVSGAPVQERLEIDAHSGRLIRQVSTIHFTDLTGNVNGWASPGILPDEPSNPPALAPLYQVHGTSPVGETDTAANGDFTITYAGSTPQPVTFDFGSDNKYANVNNNAGSEVSITQTVTPGVPSQFTFNTTQVEQETAQVNAQLAVVESWQFVKNVDPSDPHVEFRARANVMVSGSCNAYYDGGSINFFRSGGGCVNAAYTTVVTHELGHWYNDRFGSGNGGDGFGEGNADVWAIYVHDDQYVGKDFTGPGSNIRDGENKKQYDGTCNGCSGEGHECGKVLMGALWKVRRNLNNTYGDAQGDLIADTLMVHWMQAYDDKTICDTIENHWLELDDDNGNIFDGTPHFADIDAGFREQGFPGIDVPKDCTFPTNYDQGSPGSYGIPPHITSFNYPKIGTSDFTIRGENTEAQIPGFLLFGLAKAQIKYNAATILVDIIGHPYVALPVITNGIKLPGQGWVELSFKIPTDLDNMQFFSQFLFYDPGAQGGVSATEGLDGTVCCGC